MFDFTASGLKVVCLKRCCEGIGCLESLKNLFALSLESPETSDRSFSLRLACASRDNLKREMVFSSSVCSK